MQEWLVGALATQPRTVLLVTHDIEEAAFLGQRVVVLTDQPAKIKRIVMNPEMGEYDYRSAAAFRQTVAELRGALAS